MTTLATPDIKVNIARAAHVSLMIDSKILRLKRRYLKIYIQHTRFKRSDHSKERLDILRKLDSIAGEIENLRDGQESLKQICKRFDQNRNYISNLFDVERLGPIGG